jgi:hypothetical protein
MAGVAGEMQRLMQNRNPPFEIFVISLFKYLLSDQGRFEDVSLFRAIFLSLRRAVYCVSLRNERQDQHRTEQKHRGNYVETIVSSLG